MRVLLDPSRNRDPDDLKVFWVGFLQAVLAKRVNQFLDLPLFQCLTNLCATLPLLSPCLRVEACATPGSTCLLRDDVTYVLARLVLLLHGVTSNPLRSLSL